MAEYKLTVPIEKSATEDGRWVIKGKAAGIGHVDEQGMTLRSAAIERLAKRINEQPVPFKDWHQKNNSFAEMGVVTSAKVTPEFELDVEVELDQKHPFAQLLWGRMDEGKQYGMSIGGKSSDWKAEDENGTKVLAVYDVEIDEISLTTKPLWTHSLGTVIKKAIDEEQQSESVEGVEIVADTTVADDLTPESVETTSAPESVVTTEEVVVEKAVTTDTARELQKVAKLVKHIQATDALLRELGLVDVVTDPTETTAVETVQIVEKSVDETSSNDRLSALEARLQAQTSEIEILKAQIPDTTVPGLMTRQKDADKEAIEILMSSEIDPRTRIRYGLALAHNEAEKLR
jgi:hypothetical protein